MNVENILRKILLILSLDRRLKFFEQKIQSLVFENKVNQFLYESYLLGGSSSIVNVLLNGYSMRISKITLCVLHAN